MPGTTQLHDSLRLIKADGPLLSNAIEAVAPNTMTLGRSDQCGACLDHQWVYRTHADVQWTAEGWWLAGRQSTTGTPLQNTPDDFSLIGNQAGVTLSLAEALHAQAGVSGLGEGEQLARRQAAAEMARWAKERLEAIVTSEVGFDREAKAIAEAQAIIEACTGHP